MISGHLADSWLETHGYETHGSFAIFFIKIREDLPYRGELCSRVYRRFLDRLRVGRGLSNNGGLKMKFGFGKNGMLRGEFSKSKRSIKKRADRKIFALKKLIEKRKEVIAKDPLKAEAERLERVRIFNESLQNNTTPKGLDNVGKAFKIKRIQKKKVLKKKTKRGVSEKIKKERLNLAPPVVKIRRNNTSDLTS